MYNKRIGEYSCTGLAKQHCYCYNYTDTEEKILKNLNRNIFCTVMHPLAHKLQSTVC